MRRTDLPLPKKRLVFPLTCVTVGIAMLLGCFNVPSTRQFQTSGKRIPEKIVGTGGKAKIVLGTTNLADALIALREQTSGPTWIVGYLGPPQKVKADPGFAWYLTRDGRRAAVSYQLRTGTELWPLCFSAGFRFEQRWLLLELDEHGTVRDTRTLDGVQFRLLSDDLNHEAARAQTILEQLDQETRRRLIQKGLTANEETLRLRIGELEAIERDKRERRSRRAAATTRARS